MGAWLGVVAPKGWGRYHAGTDTTADAAECGKKALLAAATGTLTVTGGATQTTETEAAVISDYTSSDDDEDFLDFGLEDDGVVRTVWKGPFRKKTSDLTPDEKAKYKGLVEKIFSEDTVFGYRINFDPDDVIDVCRRVIPYLESEPVLIEDLPFGISIVGDLHGQLYDLNRVFYGDSKDGKPGWESKKYIFLGDYVDRGRQSLEIVMALFCLKMLYPDDIFLLRGNHEFFKVNSSDGFLEELLDRYTDEITEELFFQINEAFCYLSIAAILGNDYFCVHGGITTAGFTRRQMRGIYKPILSSTDDVMVHDLTWSDPAKGLNGTTYNVGRTTSFFFGFPALAHALASMQVKVIFRGHQRAKGGFERLWGCLYTIFTATDQGYSGNKGAVAVVDNRGKVSLRILEVNPRRRALEKKFDVIMGKTKVDDDVKTKFEARKVEAKK